MRAGIEVPLVGRVAELEEIRRRISNASNGSREAIVLEGEPGIGKTRLISEAIRFARDSGFTVLTATAYDFEQAREFGLLRAAFGGEGSVGDPFDDATASETFNDRRLAVIDSLVGRIDRASKVAPIALFLDDLQWADAGTLHVMRALLGRAKSFPFISISATRPVSTNDALEGLISAIEADGVRMALDPLDEECVGVLVAALLTDSLSTELRARVATALGNPFFVIEIIASGVDEMGTPDLPTDLRRTVLRRILTLSKDVRSMLRIASLLGSTIDPGELATISGRPTTDLVPLLDEALKSRVLEERSGGLTFRHEIVRDAIYKDMPASLRKKLHRDAANLLAGAGASAARIAVHFAESAEPGERDAISWLRRAGAEEAMRSPAIAADLLSRAAALIDAADPALDEVQAERIRALAWSGRVADASALASDTLSRLRDASLASDVRVSLGQSLFFQGYAAQGGELVEQAASDAPASERGLLLAGAALGRLMSGQFAGATSLVERAFEEVRVTGDARAQSLALGIRSMLLMTRGDATALHVAEEAVRVADEDFLDEAHRYGSRLSLGFILQENDRFDEAAAVLRAGIRRDQAHGVAWALPSYYALLGVQHFARGKWDDAVAELETAQALLDDMDSSLLRPLTSGLLANIALRRGDTAAAEGHLSDGDADLARAGPQVGAEWLMLARIMLAEQHNDVPLALGIARTACALAGSMGFTLAFRYFGPVYARLAVAAGVPEEAGFVADGLEAIAATHDVASITGTAQLCRGTLDSEPETLLLAVETLRTCARPLDLAIGHEQAGSTLARSDRPASRDQLTQALAVYEELGAVRDASRVSRALGRRQREPRKTRPTSGWDSLSPTEGRVADLVAEGLTNAAIAERLVVSSRTVETHVYHVFRKLGVSSRVELALKAARRPSAEEVQ